MRLRPVVVLLSAAAVVLGGAGAPDQDPRTRTFSGRLLDAVPPNTDGTPVTRLLLDGNRVTLNESDRRALGTYPALLELRLDGNRLTRVPAGFFSAAPNLTKLSLAGNDLQRLDSEAFSGLDLLTDLDLSGNRLTSLPEELHRVLNLDRLQVLRLQGNPWNCSCPLLGPVRHFSAANVSAGETPAVCASPSSKAGMEVAEAAALCFSEPPPTQTAALNRTESPGQTHNGTNAGRKPAAGNSWKFTASVAALALVTSALIVCAVKGPSLYKLFHNYRHRRLHQDDDDDGAGGNNDGHFVTTVFKKRGSYRTPHTFSFENQGGRAAAAAVEEPEDEYFEDPYIKSNGMEGEENPAEP